MTSRDWEMLSEVGFDKYDQMVLPLALVQPYYVEDGRVYFSCSDELLNKENIEMIQRDFSCDIFIDEENRTVTLEENKE
ncbi:hypothetical protein E4665_04870 [Sporolactobacillus shoreae]|uniref:Uncharacterized protein n=1 Tax=Sporolactobacillus shoreae TaxID=1465501 RepID=A0A4Z0GRL9_9BACL|nr:hypothetical protein [Sporolactobacillus shoreae]TGA99120.1 hypothetical protein E4665_04870 [Sporolactobacillus shoreae]